jgi:adenylate cyclase
MPTEIERKFLVLTDEWRSSVSRFRRLKQGYLHRSAHSSVRVRRWDGGATITVKGPREGISHAEFEYDIPLEDADEMLNSLCEEPLIEKVRYWIDQPGTTWVVDCYCGAAKGLILAEIELDRPDQMFAAPRWIGAEVTHDPRYHTAAVEALILHVTAAREAHRRAQAEPRTRAAPMRRVRRVAAPAPAPAPHGV